MAEAVLEIERKFKITAPEALHVVEYLRGHDFKLSEDCQMSDIFLPTGADSQQLLRIRSVSVRSDEDGKNPAKVLTYKTWIKTDDGGKERQEREEAIGDLAAECLVKVGRLAKDGEELPSYQKERKTYSGQCNGYSVNVSLDEVSGLGEFNGFYMEVEIIITDNAGINAAREQVYALAHEILGDKRGHHELTYLEMLTKAQELY
jgi:predicted adenylyl cyclase CyaB